MNSTGLTAIGYGWVLLSIIAASCIATGFYLPIWLVGSLQMGGRRVEATFGAFRRCNFPVYDDNLSKYRLEIACGRYASFSDIPSLYWQIAAIAIAAGVCLSILMAFIVVAAICVGDIVSRTSALVIGLVQVVAGNCNLGWAFYLMLGGAALLLICGSLSTKSGHPIAWIRRERRRLSSMQSIDQRRQSSLRQSIIPRENGAAQMKRLSA